MIQIRKMEDGNMESQMESGSPNIFRKQQRTIPATLRLRVDSSNSPTAHS